MDYIIRNNKNVCIRLNDNGTPETCGRNMAQRFENSKARNILDHLPKTMKKFHFRVEAIPDEIIHKPEIVKENVIVESHHTVPEAVKIWVSRVKNCNDLAQDATKRKEELLKALSNVDRDLSNHLHKIEFTKWKNGSEGYKAYKAVKIILERRRRIKDELIIVQSILSSNLESMAANHVEKVANNLSNRIFSMREVEEYDDL